MDVLWDMVRMFLFIVWEEEEVEGNMDMGGSA